MCVKCYECVFLRRYIMCIIETASKGRAVLLCGVEHVDVSACVRVGM